MKHSRYNHTVQTASNEYILFNAVSGAVVIVDEAFYNDYRELKLEEDTMGTLCEMGFIMEDSFDELSELRRRNMENYAKQDTKIYTICPTTYCNARCFYCFEAGKKHAHMSEEHAKAAAEFIVRDANASNASTVCLSWFGGEPLLAPQIIESITDYVREHLSPSIHLYANITTNGILFTPENIEMAKRCNIVTAQITLDGFGTEYEERKNYTNVPDAFPKIVKIIGDLADADIKVQIRLNYDENNFDSITELINYLSEHYSDRQKGSIEVYAAKLEGVHGCRSCTGSQQIASSLMQQIHFKGFSKTFDRLNLRYRFAHCLIDSDYYYVIAADGEIYKCNELVDDRSYSVGNIFDGIKKPSQPESALAHDCTECGFLPICQGGCKLRRCSAEPTEKCQMEKHILPEILALYFGDDC